MIETSRAEGGSSQDCHCPQNGQHPHPSSSSPRDWQQTVWRSLCLPGCIYLEIPYLLSSSPPACPVPPVLPGPRFWGSTLDPASLPWFSSCLPRLCVMGRGAAGSARGAQGGEPRKDPAGSSAAQRGHQPATNAPGTSALPWLLLPPEHSALLQGLALARQSLETGCRKQGFKIIYYFKCPFSWRRTRI